MRLSDLDWGEPVTGGLLKSTYTVAEARFEHAGRPCVAVEWYRRTGHPFHPYASLILIAEECDKTRDGDLLRRIAFGGTSAEAEGGPRIVRSETLGRGVILIEDPPDRRLELAPLIDTLIRTPQGGRA